ncbi:MHYT domain-containing protein [Actinoplanes sp. DH11]|uniref:MHYT domain-containing protein n=1 Tax=Actinoplanes sp. DH11 TaxID=2857011 RepID=UPI0027E1C7A8|nr:MHYT domain-containing protein [Actinoplanes sp. DH11]
MTPAVSYILSVLGSLLGLTAAVRFRQAKSGGERAWWLTLAAVAIGATGIWSMHFVAMMGFSVSGTPIRYDVGLTVASAVIAFVAVGVGLAIALLGSAAPRIRILIGGVLAGLGVAAMHYTGMAAMRLRGEIHYAGQEVVLSVAIAVVAATVALWLALNVRKPLAIFASALVMGIAVNGMHFTGMAAMSVFSGESFGSVEGATATGLLAPVGAAVVFAILGMVYALAAAPSEEDREAAAYLASRLEARPAPAAGTPPGQLWGQQPQHRQPQPGQGPGRSTLGGGNWTYRDRDRAQ